MAKKYIPGVSGLLTEPNPVDSPANTLSEAENVIVDQRGKVQARHGLNITNNDSDIKVAQLSSGNTNIESIKHLYEMQQLESDYDISIPITIDSTNNKFIVSKPTNDMKPIGGYTYTLTSGSYATLYDLVNELNDKCGCSLTTFYFDVNGNRLQLKSYINLVVLAGSINDTIGFFTGQTIFAEHERAHNLKTNSLLYLFNPAIDLEYQFSLSSFSENGLANFKLFELKNNKNDIFTGYIVKQNQNEYTYNRNIDGDVSTFSFLKHNQTTLSSYTLYQIDSTSSKILSFDKLPFQDVKNSFYNNESFYIETENGLAECSVDQLFQPAQSRFFTIKWPSYPELNVIFRQDDVFQNWFLSGYKCGFRFTFYRETGYSSEEGDVYESQPSKVYEIYNDGEDSVVDLQFSFNLLRATDDVYKEYNEFSKSNNGRKFGIKVYRTNIVKILTASGEANPLPAEYRQCYDIIPFDTILTTKLKFEKSTFDTGFDEYVHEYSLTNNGVSSVFQKENLQGELNVGDIIAYIPNNTQKNLIYSDDWATLKKDAPPLNTGTIFSERFVQYDTVNTNSRDLINAKLKVLRKNFLKNSDLTYDRTDYNTSSSSSSDITQSIVPGTTTKKQYIGVTHYNHSVHTKYINCIQFFSGTIYQYIYNSIKTETPVSPNDEIGVEIINWEDTDELLAIGDAINKGEVLSSVSLKVNQFNEGNVLSHLYDNYYNSADNTVQITLDQVFEFKPKQRIIIALWVKTLKNSYSSVPSLYLNLHSSTEFSSSYVYTTRYPHYTFSWLEGEQQAITNVFTAGLPGQAYRGRFYGALGRRDKTHSYVFEAETFVTNDPGFIRPQQILNIGDKLRNDISTEPAEVTYGQTSTSNPWRFRTSDNSADNGIYVTMPVGSKVRFTNILGNTVGNFSDINENIDYYVVENFNGFRVSTTLNGTPIDFTVRPSSTGLAVATVVNNTIGALTNYRTFVRDFKIPISLNDDSLYVGSELYTNPFKDGASNTNLLAPQAVFSKSFKNYQIYAGIKNPLRAKVAVVKQPAFEQCELGLPLREEWYIGDDPYDNTFGGLAQSFTLHLSNNPFTNIRKDNLFIESSILGPKRHNFFNFNYPDYVPHQFGIILVCTANSEIIQINSSDLDFTVNETLTTYSSSISGIDSNTTYEIVEVIEQSNNISKIKIRKQFTTTIAKPSQTGTVSAVFTPSYSDTGAVEIMNYTNTIAPISINTTGITYYTYADLRKYRFNATMFERPWLTLKLTSTSGKIDYVSVQLTPQYNRNGYYPLTDRQGNYDKKYLDANNTINKLNYAKETSNVTVKRVGFLPGMVEGKEDGQCQADAQYKGANIAIATSTNKIYFNSAENTLAINNINRFDKDRFKEPGFILVQFIGSNITKAYALLNYSNITTETNAINKYTFKNINVKYLSSNGLVVESDIATSFASLSGDTINMWFMEGSTIQGIPLYSYTEAFTQKIEILLNSSTINEHQNDALTSYPSTPILVFKQHINRESPVVAYLNNDGSLRFVGASSLDQSAYLDEYAWNIIDEFNKEFQNKGINAYLRKPDELGYFEIVYPDGRQIELINGQYNESVNLVRDGGQHVFSPAISNTSFTKLASDTDSTRYSKNEIQWSRIDIPEIVPLSCSFKLGKDTKEFIGAAQNVDDLYLFKEDGIFRLTDGGIIGNDIPNLTSAYHFSTTSICVSGNSIQEINNEIIYLDQNGFMSIVDGGLQNISGAIQRDILTLIDITPKDRIRSFKNEAKSLYYCTLINEVDDSLGVKSGTYIFSTKTRQWTFMDEEIIDGIADSNGNNVVAYRQKSPLATKSGTFSYANDYYNLNQYDGKQIVEYDAFEFDYPIQKTNNYNNFYYVSRETQTNNIRNNRVDQYDFTTGKIKKINELGSQLTSIKIVREDDNKPEFTINMPLYSNLYQYAYSKSSTDVKTDMHVDFVTYNALKYNDLFAVPYGVDLGDNKYALTDSITQFFINRTIYIKLYYNEYDGIGFTDLNIIKTYEELHAIKLKKVYSNWGYLGSSDRIALNYVFEFLDGEPTYFYSDPVDKPIKLAAYEVLAGVPAKVTFNPESGTDPDTNKLFQEYMIHTETANKGATMAFKTDSRTNFSADRRFMYDANATNRNVFRTYIPTSMSRGRYLIRQVKHDLPLENLIITGQTVVMRDSRSTRVQKDGDNE